MRYKFACETSYLNSPWSVRRARDTCQPSKVSCILCACKPSATVSDNIAFTGVTNPPPTLTYTILKLFFYPCIRSAQSVLERKHHRKVPVLKTPPRAMCVSLQAIRASVFSLLHPPSLAVFIPFIFSCESISSRHRHTTQMMGKVGNKSVLITSVDMVATLAGTVKHHYNELISNF